MRNIKVSYRATFRQPRQQINPMGLRFTAPIAVEISQERRTGWIARQPATGAPFREIPAQASADAAKIAVPEFFEQQLSDWEMCDPAGAPIHPKRVKIAPDGRVLEYEPDDFTHVQRIGAEKAQAAPKVALTACGIELRYTCFASTLENAPPPTCEVCAAYLEGMRSHLRRHLEPSAPGKENLV